MVEGKDYYTEKGYRVFTEAYHLKRGYCCGNGCRHCPYKTNNEDQMKHVSSYTEYIYEGKKQHVYTVKEGKGFNIFDLLNDLKTLGAEVLNNAPGKKGETVLTVVMQDSSKDKVEDLIKKTAEIIKVQ